jgi:hypothetical protein
MRLGRRACTIKNSRNARVRDTAFNGKEARRESAGSIHRCRGNAKDRCRQVSAWATVATRQRIQPQRKEILGFFNSGAMAGLAERHKHTGDSLAVAIQSDQPLTELLRVALSMLAALLVLYRSPVASLKMINDQGVHCLNPEIMATRFPH